MRRIEVRRHSVRDKPSEHLSASGRKLAEEVGRGSGPFQIVVSGDATRAVETAEAMGWSPSARLAVWRDGGGVPWPLSFAEYRQAMDAVPAVGLQARRIRAEVVRLLGRLADGEAALVATHGGFPELAAASWVSPAEAEGLGPACRCMEGVNLEFTGGDFDSARDLRVPADRTRL